MQSADCLSPSLSRTPEVPQSPSRTRHAHEQRLQIEKLTKRLYTLKRNPMYVAENRVIQSQLVNLRQITRQAKVEREKSSLSTIHNMSVTMIEAIKGARMRRSSPVQDDALAEALPRQMSLQPLLPRKSSYGSSSLQIKTLTAKMEPVLEFNATHLAQPTTATSKAKQSSTHSRNCSLDLTFPDAEAETVLAQLKRDIRRLDTKVRLLVSSLLLLEEEVASCSSLCLKEKKRKLERRARSLRTLMGFLKEVRERAAKYVSVISAALLGPILREYRDRFSALIADIKSMASCTSAIDFISAKVEVRDRIDLSKCELLTYGQVSFAHIVPKLKGTKAYPV